MSKVIPVELSLLWCETVVWYEVTAKHLCLLWKDSSTLVLTVTGQLKTLVLTVTGQLKTLVLTVTGQLKTLVLTVTGQLKTLVLTVTGQHLCLQWQDIWTHVLTVTGQLKTLVLTVTGQLNITVLTAPDRPDRHLPLHRTTKLLEQWQSAQLNTKTKLLYLQNDRLHS